MVRIKVLAALMTGLAASACASGSPQSAQSATSIAFADPNYQQECADNASTGDSYRYCMEVGLDQAGLARPGSDDSTSVAALRAD